jgi:hypothetical protein
MSHLSNVTIYCDASDGCTRQLATAASDLGTARVLTARGGWRATRFNGRTIDLCPTHAHLAAALDAERATVADSQRRAAREALRA